MCGIVAILNTPATDSRLRQHVVELGKLIRHRGPDWSGIWTDGTNFLCHERLAIVDPDSGAQPIQDATGQVILVVNGEVYNHKHLKENLRNQSTPITDNDCEAILHTWMEDGENVCNMIDGIFAFVIVDTRQSPPAFIAARDPLGVIPMYYGHRADGSIMFASEMKCLVDECVSFEIFPPGHLITTADNAPRRWYNPKWIDESIPSCSLNLSIIRSHLEAAVIKRMMCDVPYGVLLSGGLDSSLVASIVNRYSRTRVENDGKSEAWWPRLHTFSIGLVDSPDLVAARKVSEYLGTVHHEYNFTIQEGIDAIPEVINAVETYDVTTIRASTPMYLMSRKIKAMGVKMVLSGEGADEIFGGYLYFWKAPSKEEFHMETCRKLKALHLFDCARANKSTAAWGVEARVPFLDKTFVEHAMSLDPEEKMCKNGRIEKWVLRKAFDTPDNPYLPHDVLWRQKEQFSDGVGYAWIDALQQYAEKNISDTQMEAASEIFSHNTPVTKEAYWYREIFENCFKCNEDATSTVPGGKTIACSTPSAIAWDESFQNRLDNSGRSVHGIHKNAY